MNHCTIPIGGGLNLSRLCSQAVFLSPLLQRPLAASRGQVYQTTFTDVRTRYMTVRLMDQFKPISFNFDTLVKCESIFINLIHNPRWTFCALVAGDTSRIVFVTF